MQKISLYDTLKLKKKSSGIFLRCSDKNLPSGQQNLSYKAAEVFFSSMSIKGGVDIDLEKRIPVAAGLGGGSSDAAAVLRGLNILYNTQCPDKDLMEMGVQLGADVPFFVVDSPSVWATGIGEKLRKKDPMPDCSIVLVNPGFSVSTNGFMRILR
jgi:4-diphosphocytidyl-2-C-methyl-D-erythritol kinase